MSGEYKLDLVAAGIPATVRWLRLPRVYSGQELDGVLSSSTRVVFWADEQSWLYYTGLRTSLLLLKYE